MSETLIKVEGVSKKFCRSLKRSLWYGMQDLGRELVGLSHGGSGELRRDEFWAVKDVSFELKRGECLGLIGHNGAGKTTLLRMLNGLIKPDQGRIEMRGRVGALIALGAGFNPVLTGRENIYVNAAVLGLSKRDVDERLDEIIEFSELSEFIDSPVQSYSSGMVVRLGFAIAIKTDPDILLLDEVLAVGDVGFQVKCFNALAELRKSGTAFILVSHNMHQVSRYAERAIYLNRGEGQLYGAARYVIARFLESVNSSDLSVRAEMTGWSGANGTGGVRFQDACFFSVQRRRVEEIKSGDGVIVAIKFKRCIGRVDNPVLDLIVRDKEGVVYQGTSSMSGGGFDCLPEEGCFEVFFSSLPVNSRWLDFSFALLDGRTAEVYDWKRNVRLGVKVDSGGHGRLALPVTWSLC